MADEFDDKDLKGALHAWRESVEKQAEHEEAFWTRQRARIKSRIERPRVQRMPVLAWAGIAATVTLGVALMVPGDKPSTVNPTNSTETVATVNQQVSDHELMLQLQDTMNSSVPDALQPAGALAQELDQAYSGTVKSNPKENEQ